MPAPGSPPPGSAGPASRRPAPPGRPAPSTTAARPAQVGPAPPRPALPPGPGRRPGAPRPPPGVPSRRAPRPRTADRRRSPPPRPCALQGPAQEQQRRRAPGCWGWPAGSGCKAPSARPVVLVRHRSGLRQQRRLPPRGCRGARAGGARSPPAPAGSSRPGGGLGPLRSLAGEDARAARAAETGGAGEAPAAACVRRGAPPLGGGILGRRPDPPPTPAGLPPPGALFGPAGPGGRQPVSDPPRSSAPTRSASCAAVPRRCSAGATSWASSVEPDRAFAGDLIRRWYKAPHPCPAPARTVLLCLSGGREGLRGCAAWPREGPRGRETETMRVMLLTAPGRSGSRTPPAPCRPGPAPDPAPGLWPLRQRARPVPGAQPLAGVPCPAGARGGGGGGGPRSRRAGFAPADGTPPGPGRVRRPDRRRRGGRPAPAPGLPVEQALAEPLACAVNTVRELAPAPADRIVLLGRGLWGCS